MALGYDQNLFLLAFDHRGSSHQAQAFGVAGALTPEATTRITDAKSVIFDGFARALEAGAPRADAGILVDEQFGAALARRAIANDWTCAIPVERSGLPGFDFEYGEDFAAHIAAFDPPWVKALIRYNPDGPAADHERSLSRLARLGDWLAGTDRRFLCELIVPATPDQLASLDGDRDRYVTDVRPGLIRQGIADLQAAGIEPDVWKVEGIDRADDCRMIVAQARAGGRDRVSCVVLGAGVDSARVEHWLRTAAGVDGYTGFAIGRTIWGPHIRAYLDGRVTRDGATAQIAASYRRTIEVSRASI